MSTVPATPNIPMQAAPWRRALVRSLWKELRAVRPLAIGVFVLAAITSVALGELLEFHYNTAIGNQARLWGVVAFFAAALHAVGAAAALLAGEREDGADQFYEAVVAPPATIYAAKVLAIVASSAGIVAAMWLAATVLGNSGALRAFALMGGDGGVWMVWLGLVWGVLAALLCPQPLLAAVLGIALASIASHLLVEAAYHLSRGRISSHYLDGIWLYLPATLAVFVLDAWLGVRWATPGRTPRRAWWRRSSVASESEGETTACHGSVSCVIDATAGDALTAHRAVARAGAAGAGRRERPLRSAMLARLAWQTWQENRWTLLAAIVVGVLLIPAVELPLWFVRDQGANWLPPLPVSLLLVPALLGAMAFRADHRRGSYAFLDQKAARPRLTWLARQAWWLTAAVAIAAIVFAGVVGWVALQARSFLTEHLSLTHWNIHALDTDAARALRIRAATEPLWRAALLAWWGWLAAYGWGQLCSLMVRRDVLAGFLAAFGAVVLCAAGWIAFAWDLSGVAFLAPVAVIAVAVSWWAAPQFLARRAGWRDWLKPLAVFGLAGVVAAWALPQARLAQVAQNPPYEHLSLANATHAMPSAALAAPKEHERAAGAIETQYRRAASDILWEIDALRRVDQPYFTPEERAAAEAMVAYVKEHADQDEPQGGRAGGGFGGYGSAFAGDELGYGAEDDSNQPPHPFYADEALWYATQSTYGVDLSASNPEVAPWLRLLEQSQVRRRRAFLDAHQDVIKRTIEISRAPQGRLARSPKTWELANLMWEDAERWMQAGDLDAAWQRIATIARMFAHTLRFARTIERQEQLALEPCQAFREVLGHLIPRWAATDGQTPQRLRAAALDLLAVEAVFPPFSAAVIADYGHLRDVASGDEPPFWIDRPPLWPKGKRPQAYHWTGQLELLAQQFSWERERSLRAAELLTADRLDFAAGVEAAAIDMLTVRRVCRASGLWQPLTLLAAADPQEVHWSDTAARQEAIEQASTSYLIADEWHRLQDSFGRSLDDDLAMQTRRRANVLVLLLAAYHLEHGEYPATLAAAVEPMKDAEVPLLSDEGRATRPFTSFSLADPYTREPLRYEPRGFDAALTANDAIAGAMPLRAGTPLLWSGGSCQLEPAEVEQDRGANTDELSYPRPRYGNGNRQEGKALRYEFRYPANAESFGEPRLPSVIPLPRLDDSLAAEESNADEGRDPTTQPEHEPQE
ncbi:MAG: hypothetical protein CMJ58_20975 [Planctomycetaceae bacterium]|nr:hypothetical protein [Planctomycetaceae bacterium]